MTRMTYRRPLIGMAPAAFVCLVLLFAQDLTLRYLAFWLIAFSALMFWRQGLIVSEAGLEVTLIRTRRIPWSEVRSLERGTRLRGGLRVETSIGTIWSPAPASWWGGPASAEQIAEIESARPTHRRRQGRGPSTPAKRAPGNGPAPKA